MEKREELADELLPRSGAMAERVTRENDASIDNDGRFVLYWMTTARRPYDNFALQRAEDWCKELGRPLLVFEPLRVAYPWASDRIHHFVIEGMRDNARYFGRKGVRYFPYLERETNEAAGLLESLVEHSCVVVTDTFPCFFIPHMVRKTSQRLRVLLESVDSNGVLPLRAFDKSWSRAADFRRAWHKRFLSDPDVFPLAEPLRSVEGREQARVPRSILDRFPPAKTTELDEPDSLLSSMPIDHDVSCVSTRGGYKQAKSVLSDFISRRSDFYGERGNLLESPESRLSPYLHFGHVFAGRILREVAGANDWSSDSLRAKNVGRREGFWGMKASSEAFLDELLTWRELSYNYSHHNVGHDDYETIPAWARSTLEEHRKDKREQIYSLEQLESGDTSDPLWNAAQKELSQSGALHGYLRMLWGKRVIEWTHEPAEAFEALVQLNNKYALDGRDPNSYSGIAWCFGRFDRPWGPERPIFGKVRYMNSQGARRKFEVDDYVDRWTGGNPRDGTSDDR